MPRTMTSRWPPTARRSTTQRSRPVRLRAAAQPFAAMAFNVKYFTDFTYNSGASSLFNNGSGGDDSPNSLYTIQADIKQESWEPRQGP